MMKSFLKLLLIGFIGGAGLAVLGIMFPAIDNLIPDTWGIIIIGALIGGTYGLLSLRRSDKPKEHK